MNKFNLHAFADEAGKDVKDQIAALTGNDYQGIEVRKVGDKNVTELTIEEAKELKKQLNDKGLYVWSIGSPIGKIDIDGDFEAHMEVYKHTLELSAVLEAKAIRIFSFYMPDGKDPMQYEGKVIDQMGRFVDAAKGYDAALCHENEKGIFGDIAIRCRILHRALPNLGGIFDPANFVQCKEDTLDAWDMLKPYIKYLHIKDANELGKVVPAGEGLGNIPTILKAYYEMGGRDLTLEPHLKVFDGLKDLEKDFDSTMIGGRVVYKDARTAFDTAVRALNKLIEVI